MDLQKIIEKLEAQGRITHVKSEVDPAYELSGIAKKMEGGNAVLFENVKGHNMPVLCGLWWNRDNVGAAFDTTGKDVKHLFAKAASEFEKNPIECVVVENAPCQEVVSLEPDLYELPTPTLALKDGGPYFSNCVVIAKDPDTGVRNTSIHRIQVTGKNRCTMLMDLGRHLRDYYERAEAKGVPLEITINDGVDPAIYVSSIYAGTPIDMDELGIAAQLRGEPVQLSKSKTVGVEGIAEAQVVIEAEILPHVRESEGPFGEVSGYYASNDNRWTVNVRAITRRANPVWHTLLPGKEVWNSIGLTAEPSVMSLVSRQIPGVKDVHFTHGCCGNYGAVIQMEPKRKGFGKNAIMAAFAAFPMLNMGIAVNTDIDIYNCEEIMQAITTRCVPQDDIFIIPCSACHELNPIMDNGYGAKVGFDCTVSIAENPKFERVAFKDVDLKDYVIE